MSYAKASILVVDDNAANVALYERVINGVDGCVAVCFTSAVQALGWCHQNDPPLLAVVDYRMPVMDGLAFIRDFRLDQKNARTPVVLLTGVNNPALRDEAKRLGIHFLAKPIARQALVEVIERARRLPHGIHGTVE